MSSNILKCITFSYQARAKGKHYTNSVNPFYIVILMSFLLKNVHTVVNLSFHLFAPVIKVRNQSHVSLNASRALKKTRNDEFISLSVQVQMLAKGKK